MICCAAARGSVWVAVPGEEVSAALSVTVTVYGVLVTAGPRAGPWVSAAACVITLMDLRTGGEFCGR